MTKPEVDSFLSTSSKFFETDTGTTGFVHRLWISTTNKWNSTAEQTIRNLNPPVTRLNLIDLENDEVDWNSLEQEIFGKASRSKPLRNKRVPTGSNRSNPHIFSARSRHGPPGPFPRQTYYGLRYR
nr:hypothetical protein [Millionella massiliensis]